MESWQEIKLRDCLTIKHGRSQKEVESPTGTYPILGTGGQIGLADAFLYNKPSVLIGRKGTINKPRFMDTPFWTVDTLFYSHIKDNAIAKFIYYIFLTINWYSYNEASGVPSLSASTISNIKLLLPSTAEQKRIVAVLEVWDEHLEKLDKKIELKMNIKKGLMQQLLTGKKRLPGFDEDWKSAALHDLATISTGKKDVNEGNSNGKYPFFTCSRKHTYSDNYSYDFEAILIAGNADVGHCKYYVGQFEAYQRTYILSRFKTVQGKYLFHYMNYFFKNYVESLKQIGAMSFIKLPMLKSFTIQLPSPAEQEAISRLFDTAEAEIGYLERYREFILKERGYLLNNLVSGKIRTPENLIMPAKEVQYA
jgi:type I restriction enzyme S subunit